MTAKNRKAKTTPLPGLDDVVGTHEDDFYRTPSETTDAALRDPLRPGSQVVPLREPKTWIDCGAGDGAIAEVVARRWPASQGIAVELNPVRAVEARRRFAGLEYGGRITVVQDDFLRARLPSVDLVIGNPPYSVGGGALAFARRAVELGRETALLLRVGFLEGEQDEDRDVFLERQRHDLAVLPWRPAFRGNGDTDSATYMWIFFGPGRGGHYVRLPRRSVGESDLSTRQPSLF